MCRVLKISESGYYRWLKNQSKPTARVLLSVKIQIGIVKICAVEKSPKSEKKR